MDVRLNSSDAVLIYMVSSTDSKTAVTGATVSVSLTKGGAFSAGAGSVVEAGFGFYWYVPGAGDWNTLGTIGLRATASGCDPFPCRLNCVAVNPRDAAAFGLTRLDEAISSRLATTGYTAPDNTGIAAVLSRLPATLDTGRIRASVEAISSGVSDSLVDLLLAEVLGSRPAGSVGEALATSKAVADRYNALLENVGGDRFKAKTLEQAPAGGGGGGGFLSSDRDTLNLIKLATDKLRADGIAVISDALVAGIATLFSGDSYTEALNRPVNIPLGTVVSVPGGTTWVVEVERDGVWSAVGTAALNVGLDTVVWYPGLLASATWVPRTHDSRVVAVYSGGARRVWAEFQTVVRV